MRLSIFSLFPSEWAVSSIFSAPLPCRPWRQWMRFDIVWRVWLWSTWWNCHSSLIQSAEARGTSSNTRSWMSWIAPSKLPSYTEKWAWFLYSYVKRQPNNQWSRLTWTHRVKTETWIVLCRASGLCSWVTITVRTVSGWSCLLRENNLSNSSDKPHHLHQSPLSMSNYWILKDS